MAELLIKAVSAQHANPDKDKRGCYKAGMIVEIRPDGCIYGTSECMPTFFVVKIPLIPVDHPLLVRLMNVQQVQNGLEEDGVTPRYVTTRRRRCWLKASDIPLAAKQKIAETGELIIKAAAAYNGPYDYTWLQVKNYFWDDDTQQDMSNETLE